MDWEYPIADDRGGKPEDKANFVLLSRDIYNAFEKEGYGYSLTLPASYWYLQHFDLTKLQPYGHWFNLMSSLLRDMSTYVAITFTSMP